MMSFVPVLVAVTVFVVAFCVKSTGHKYHATVTTYDFFGEKS